MANQGRAGAFTVRSQSSRRLPKMRRGDGGSGCLGPGQPLDREGRAPRRVLRFVGFAMHHTRISRNSCSTSTAG